MAANYLSEAIQHIRQALRPGDEAGLSDGQLLGCFVEQRDELALAEIVRRHGPMVWAVCRRILVNYHDAEDAFQATYLVLVRKAATVKPRELVGHWLYGVARQTAVRARANAALRAQREQQLATLPEPVVESRQAHGDLQGVLDWELGRLAERYRVPVVLCDLQGKTHKEAARQVGCPEGTLSARLTRARALLARRLARHGLVVSAGALAAFLAEQAVASSTRSAVVAKTIKAAVVLAAGQTIAASATSARAAALTERVLQAMLLNRVKKMAGVALLFAAMALTCGFLIAETTGARGQSERTPTVHQEAKGDGNKTRETNPLEGEWKLLSAERNGQHQKLDDAEKEMRLIFKGEDLTFTFGTGVRKLKFKLNAAKSPKEIDLTSLDGQEKGQTMACIYSLEMGKLHLCMPYFKDSTIRPDEFKTQADDGRMIFIMERPEPKRQEAPAQDKTEAEKKLKALYKERYTTLKKIADQLEKQVAGGQASTEELASLRLKVHTAELDVCESDQERLEVHKKIVALYRERENRVRVLAEKGATSAGSLLEAHLQVLEAEIALQKLRVKMAGSGR